MRLPDLQCPQIQLSLRHRYRRPALCPKHRLVLQHPRCCLPGSTCHRHRSLRQLHRTLHLHRCQRCLASHPNQLNQLNQPNRLRPTFRRCPRHPHPARASRERYLVRCRAQPRQRSRDRMCWVSKRSVRALPKGWAFAWVLLHCKWHAAACSPKLTCRERAAWLRRRDSSRCMPREPFRRDDSRRNRVRARRRLWYRVAARK
jgi:hypothetical protein